MATFEEPKHYSFTEIGRAIVWFYQEHGYIDISDTYDDELALLVEKYRDHILGKDLEDRR